MRKIVLSVFISTLFYTFFSAQSKADVYFESNYFNEAIHHLEIELQRKKSDKKEVLFKLAESHFQLRNFKTSLEYFVQLYDLGSPDSLTVVRLFDLHRNACNYNEAAKVLENNKSIFNDLTKENKVVFPNQNSNKSDEEVSLIENIKTNKGMGYSFIDNAEIIIGIVNTVNTDRLNQNEFVVFDLNKDGQTEVRTDKLKALGLSYPSYNKQQEKVYFSASGFKKKRSFSEKDNVLQIYEADFDGLTLSNIQRLSFASENYNYSHPSISKDGNKLYFISDMPNGFGGTDIYMVEKGDDEKWLEPVNCGANVNTIHDEITPSILGDTLFFSSYGHQNYGGSDIFITILKNDKFSPAQNLGLPINSCQDDFSFVMSPSNEFALITSNRSKNNLNEDLVYKINFPPNDFYVLDSLNGEFISDVSVTVKTEGKELLTDQDGKWLWRNSKGAKEIIFDHPYYWKEVFTSESLNDIDVNQLKEMKLAPVLIRGKAVDDITGNAISDVKVSLYEKEGDNWNLVEIRQTQENGDWSFHVRKDREYKVEFEKEKYLTGNEIFERFNNDRDLHNEAMKRVNPLEMSYKPEKDLVMQIDNIYFDYNKASLRSESFKVLDKLTEYLLKNPTIQIELSAHTDCIGKDSYNLNLSQRRANSCKDYLLKKGVAKDRIVPKGYGKRKMIITDCDLQRRDDSAAQKNRRVEVKIL